MNILFLSHRIPYPPDKGDKIRSYNEIKYLSRRHRIYLATIIEEESDRLHIPHLKRYCQDVSVVLLNKKLQLLKNFFLGSSFSVSSFYCQELQQYVNRVLQRAGIDVVICFCSSMAEYIFRAPSPGSGSRGVKLIMDYVDLDSDKWQQYAKYSSGLWRLIYKIESKRLFEYEKQINGFFHHSIFVSEREVKIFKEGFDGAESVWEIPNGVNLEYFSPCEAVGDASGFTLQKKGPVLVFTGIMDYFANEDGVRWFCEKIFPKIRSAFPTVEFYIVGNHPTNVVWKLSEIDGVTVTGYVKDIREYYWFADICIAPLRIARGLQNKVLEAMATGNAVVATSNASDGIVCHKDEDIIVADDVNRFAEAVIMLLQDKEKRRALGREARENICRNYSWGTSIRKLETLFER